jgi:hypothetical protein
MTTAYTTLLGLALPVPGELTGTWGTTVNNSITQLLDDAVAGTATANVTSGDWTLTDTGSGAPNQARCAILIATGTPGVSRNIIAPARSKGYFVVNQSDAAVVLKGASTTGISIPTNKSALVVWNGSDFVTAVSPSSSGTVTTLSVVSANGFTGTVANPTSAPAITLTTSISGVLKGNGTAISAATSGTDFSAGTSGLATGILKSTTSTGALSIAIAGTDYQTAQSVTGIVKSSGTTRSAATVGTDYSAGTSALATGILKSTTSTGALTIAVAGDFPTLNQSTTGTAANLTAATTLPSGMTLVAPILGTPASGTLSSCTVDGTNAVGYKNIPQTGSDKTTAYELVLTDVGKYVGVGASGSVVVPTSRFANGDAISIYNNTTGNITITTSAPTAYIAGTNTVKTSITLATRGIATILFVSATVCVVSGNVS